MKSKRALRGLLLILFAIILFQCFWLWNLQRSNVNLIVGAAIYPTNLARLSFLEFQSTRTKNEIETLQAAATNAQATNEAYAALLSTQSAGE